MTNHGCHVTDILTDGVSFKLFDKIDVNGPDASPLFEWMKAEQPGIFGFKRVKWNFEKFLIGRDGLVKKRWAPPVVPGDLKVPVYIELEKTVKKGPKEHAVLIEKL